MLLYTVRHMRTSRFPRAPIACDQAEPDISQQLFTARCERGAEIVQCLSLTATVDAIRTLDEHCLG